MKRAARVLAIGLGLAALFLTGCAGGAWRNALRADSVSAYARFLRDHPGSRYREEARAHLEYLRVQRNPSLDALSSFLERFPESPLSEELQPLLERVSFDAARGRGSAEAYRRFVEEFPNSVFAKRAAGNAAYLSRSSPPFDVDALTAFAAEHPESDFSAEALRSTSSLSLREQTAFGVVGLSVEVSKSTPEADRVRREFTERALAQAESVGMKLVPLRQPRVADTQQRPPLARLQIRHAEQTTPPSLSGGELSSSEAVGETSVILRIGERGPVVWERHFALRSKTGDQREAASLLFSPQAKSFWGSFFIPAVRWQSNAAIRVLLKLAKPVSAVDGSGSRAVVLFRDGDLQLLDLADPASPVVLAQRVRQRSGRDFSRWTGVRVLGDRVALFGEDGIEVVRWQDEGPETVRALGRGEVGSLVAVERLNGQLILAGSRGLLRVDAGGAAPERLLQRSIRGLAKIGNGLIFTDGESLFVSTLPLLREGRVSAQVHLGRGFGPGLLRAFESTVVVIGDAGVLVLDTHDPRRPRALSRLYNRQVGRVVDAGFAGGRVFLLGERGLQVLDASLARVEDSVDLGTRDRATVLGRQLIAIGEAGVQVVDLTPFVTSATPARPE